MTHAIFALILLLLQQFHFPPNVEFGEAGLFISLGAIIYTFANLFPKEGFNVPLICVGVLSASFTLLAWFAGPIKGVSYVSEVGIVGIILLTLLSGKLHELKEIKWWFISAVGILVLAPTSGYQDNFTAILLVVLIAFYLRNKDHEVKFLMFFVSALATFLIELAIDLPLIPKLVLSVKIFSPMFFATAEFLEPQLLRGTSWTLSQSAQSQ